MTTATNTRRGRVTVAASALSALVLSVSACADRSSDSSAGVLNVGQISDSVAFFALHVAEEQGYFEEEGVELGERPRLGTGAKVAAALQSGSIDVGAGVLTDALNTHDTDDSTQLVSNLVEKYYVDVIVGENFDGPAEDAPLDERIEALVSFLFERVGLDPSSDAELVNLGGDPAGALGALESGQVDALSFFQPVPQQAEATDVGSTYISPTRGDIPDLENPTHGAVFASEETVGNKSEEVAAFQTAIERANEDIKEAPEIQELLADYMEGIDEEARDELLPLMQGQLPPESGFEQESVDTALEFHESTGLVSDPPSYEEIVPEDLRRE